MKLEVTPVPLEKLPQIIAFFRGYGVTIDEYTYGGTFTCGSGSGWFYMHGGTLTVVIEEHKSHFPERMLRGGLRQAVSEIVEQV